MAKPIENAYDPTETNVLEDILNRNASRRKPATPATEDIGSGIPDDIASTDRASLPADKTDKQNGILLTSQPDNKLSRHTDDKSDSQHDSQIVSMMARQPDDRLDSQMTGKAARQQVKKMARQPSDRLHWRDLQVLEAPRVLVSFRIPETFNDWVEDYVHAHRKEGLTKQDVLTWAIGVLQQQISAEEGR